VDLKLMPATRASQWRKVALLLLVALFAVVLYTFLHEGGHALAALLSGGTLTAFSINFLDLSAHVSYTGALTRAQTIVNNAAGAALPLLAWLGFMLAVPKRTNLALEWLKVVATLMCLNTLLAWIVLPVVYLSGQAPNDDVTNFLNNSAAPPLLVSGAALLLYLGGWLLFARKLDAPRALLARLRQPDQAALTPAVRRTALALAGILAACALAAFGLNGFRLTTPARDPFLPPTGYVLIETFEVAGVAYDAHVAHAFHLAAAQPVGVYLLISQLDAEYFEVELVGPEPYRRVLLHGEGYTPERDGARFEDTLPPGDYQLLLTSRAARGTVSVYVKDQP
jgi:hypothetical protein